MSVYKRQGSKFLYMGFYHKSKRARKKIPTTRKDLAAQYEAGYRAKLLREETGLDQPDLPLADLVSRYLIFSQTNNSPGTVRPDELSLRTFHENSGVRMVSEISPLLMGKYKAGRAGSVSSRTVNIEVKTVKATAEKVGMKGVGLHTLRHTFASHLVMAGVDPATVQKLLGHSSITTTMIYDHLAPDHLRGAVQKLKFEA